MDTSIDKPIYATKQDSLERLKSLAPHLSSLPAYLIWLSLPSGLGQVRPSLTQLILVRTLHAQISDNWTTWICYPWSIFLLVVNEMWLSLTESLDKVGVQLQES